MVRRGAKCGTVLSVVDEGASSERHAAPATVAEAMTRRENCVTPDATISELASRLAQGRDAIPVVEDGEYLTTVGAGVVSDTLAAGRDPARTTVADVIRGRPRPPRQVAIAPDASLAQANAKMVISGTKHLLIVDDGLMVGVLGRGAIEPYLYEPPDGYPLPPEELMGLVTGDARPQARGRRGKSFFTSGEQTAAVIRTVLREYGRPIEECRAVLDFGCGCGRVIRHFRRLSDARLQGSDYNEELIAWCRANLPFAEFAVNGLEPGLEYGDDTFDLVYALSVFTHLTAPLQTAWMTELRRIVSPGGTLFVTVHGESRTSRLSPQHKDAFARGELVVVEPEVPGTNECAAYHPHRYLEDSFARDLGLVAHLPDAMLPMAQDIVLLEKPAQ
jgi:SAM-dependent methyltransferase